MYHLISGIYSSFVQVYQYNILIIGLHNAGKTSFLEAVKKKYIKFYKGMNAKHIPPTIGLNLGEIEVPNKIRLNFFDLGGLEEIRHLWQKYYEETHGIIYVIDTNDSSKVKDSLDVFKEMIGNDKLRGVPLVILANKRDNSDCAKIKQIESEFENPLLVGTRECITVGASSLTGEGVEESVSFLSKAVMRRSVIY